MIKNGARPFKIINFFVKSNVDMPAKGNKIKRLFWNCTNIFCICLVRASQILIYCDDTRFTNMKYENSQGFLEKALGCLFILMIDKWHQNFCIRILFINYDYSVF
jgi:hypothetical protein